MCVEVDQKTQALLDEHEAQARMAAEGQGNPDESDTAKDEKAKKTIEELVANRAATVRRTTLSIPVTHTHTHL